MVVVEALAIGEREVGVVSVVGVVLDERDVAAAERLDERADDGGLAGAGAAGDADDHGTLQSYLTSLDRLAVSRWSALDRPVGTYHRTTSHG